MNSPALCWFSNCLYSQVHVRQVPGGIFWWRRSAQKTRLYFCSYDICITCTIYFWNKCKLSNICNVMVVYFDYYMHWIWYSTWSQPRKCFRLWFSGCDIFPLNNVLRTWDFEGFQPLSFDSWSFKSIKVNLEVLYLLKV